MSSIVSELQVPLSHDTIEVWYYQSKPLQEQTALFLIKREPSLHFVVYINSQSQELNNGRGKSHNLEMPNRTGAEPRREAEKHDV